MVYEGRDAGLGGGTRTAGLRRRRHEIRVAQRRATAEAHIYALDHLRGVISCGLRMSGRYHPLPVPLLILCLVSDTNGKHTPSPNSKPTRMTQKLFVYGAGLLVLPSHILTTVSGSCQRMSS